MDQQRMAFTAGTGTRVWQYMGCHADMADGQSGHRFRVWAPNAVKVCLMGDFNDWNPDSHTLFPLGDGIWERFQTGLEEGFLYKYAVHTKDGRVLVKSDPYAFYAELRPGTASRIYEPGKYEWGDKKWLSFRKRHKIYENPLNIYELHLGSWRRNEKGEFLTYREIAALLIPYIKELGYTHVELLPITEHPFDGSWGYQCTGYFAPTSRFGQPHDFAYLVDQLHQAGIGVILDWVPAHFPKDAFGLYEFDGTPTYEYADLRKSEHPNWGTRVFDFSRNEVRSFLISSAMYWLEEYHIDGLRVDAVASMLYLNFGREEGQWVPNRYGGQENLEAIDFLRQLNTAVLSEHPDVMMIAEESTAWPGVTRPADEGGLGFNLKWNMGWMNDIHHYIKLDPIYRQYNHKDITFSLMYAFNENFILPFSHDEVVHLKKALLTKMPGTDEERYAGVRVLVTYMLAHPGKSLLFMGAEFGQWHEWQDAYSLDWHLLDMDSEDGQRHRRLHAFFKEVNNFYLKQRPLWEVDDCWDGFQWLEPDDKNGNTIAFMRKDKKGNPLIILCNFSPVFRDGYLVGAPFRGIYQELFNTDYSEFGGRDRLNPGNLRTEDIPCHGQKQRLKVDLPPMGAVVLKCTRKTPSAKKADTEVKA